MAEALRQKACKWVTILQRDIKPHKIQWFHSFTNGFHATENVPYRSKTAYQKSGFKQNQRPNVRSRTDKISRECPR